MIWSSYFDCFLKKKNDVVIDWKSALSQCSGDEKFLHELLKETHTEIKTPFSELDNYSDNSIREYAHMVKGVSQNLFCIQLEKSSSKLEKIVISGSEKEIKSCIKYLKISFFEFEQLLKTKNIIE